MKKRLFLLDIDGTICRGNALIPGAGAFLQAVRRSGGQFVFITNNATRGTADYIRFFRRCKEQGKSLKTKQEPFPAGNGS